MKNTFFDNFKPMMAIIYSDKLYTINNNRYCIIKSLNATRIGTYYNTMGSHFKIFRKNKKYCFHMGNS